MARYVLAYRGGMPQSPEEGTRMMEDWAEWMENAGDALIEKGGGFRASRFLRAPGDETPSGDPLSGYTVIEAPNFAAALEIAGRNPIFSLGGTIEVAECMEM